MSDSPLTDRSLFRAWARETCRYGDTDRQGHVNNAVFATFCETGRTMFLRGEGRDIVPDGSEIVIVRLVLDYRGELQWTNVVDIGSAITRIGRTSFTMGQGLFHDERCVATSENTMVLLDSATRRPTPLPESLRRHMVAHAIEGVA